MIRLMTITMSDGSVWGVPVDMIARNRAEFYAGEFGGVERSLAEDTLPLFAADDYAIEDWAVSQMNWSDFDGHQVKISGALSPDFLDEWMSGYKAIINHEEKTI